MKNIKEKQLLLIVLCRSVSTSHQSELSEPYMLSNLPYMHAEPQNKYDFDQNNVESEHKTISLYPVQTQDSEKN